MRLLPDPTERQRWLDFAREYARSNALEIPAESIVSGLEIWHANVRNIRWHGPAITARNILNGQLRHHSIPDLPPLRESWLAPLREGKRFRARTWLIPGAQAAPDVKYDMAAYDVNGMYLSAAAMELGHGEPEHLHGTAAQESAWRKLPGFVRVQMSNDEVWPFDLHNRIEHRMWVAAPLAAWIDERTGGGVKIAETLTWPQHRRWLDTHVDMFRKARHAIMTVRDMHERLTPEWLAADLALGAIKAIYTRMFGGLLRSQRFNAPETVRQDWAELIVGMGQARMFRGVTKALEAAQVRPVGVHVDAVWFLMPSDVDEPPGLEITPQLGKFKPVGRAAWSPELEAAYQRGRWSEMRRALA